MEDPIVDKIVNYTLHILFLVTGEEYMIVKKMPTGKLGVNRPDIKLLTDKLLELTNNIIHLVSAQEKVPPAEKEIPQTPQAAGTGQANVIPEPVKMEQDFTPCMKALQQSQEKGILTEQSGSEPQSLVKSEPVETSCVTGLQQPKEKEMAEVPLTDTAVCDTQPAVKMELDLPSSSALQKPEAMEISEDIRPGPSNVVVKTEPEELPCVKGLPRLKEKEITTNIKSGVAKSAPDVVVKMEPEEVPCGEKTQQMPLQKKAPVAVKAALPTYIVTCAPDPVLPKGIDLQGRPTTLIDSANVSSFSSPKATDTPGSFTTVKCQWGTGPWIQTGGSAVLLAPAACFVATPPDPWKIIFPPKTKPNRPPAVYDEEFLKQRRLERQSRPPLFRLEDSHLWDPIIDESMKKKIPPTPEVASGKPKRLGHTDWCSCYNCSVMPTEEESVCCRNIADMDRLFTKDITCVCDLDYVKNKLVDRAHVKELHGYAASYKKTHLCKVADMMERDVRKAAYRAFTLWIYGHLGSKSRRPIPSCVVDCVRTHFSALDHTFIGIRTAEDDYDATDMCT